MAIGTPYIVCVQDMWMIAGLGNPGNKYKQTRHNAGFIVLDELIRQLSGSWKTGKWDAEYGQINDPELGPVAYIKPQTFMNLSGKSIQPALGHFKIQPENLLVVHDEIDLPFGELKFKNGGGHRGHNGLRDIKARLGHGEFQRLRFGVGRSENEHISVADHVLSNFSKSEQSDLPALVDQACHMILSHLKG